CGSSKNFKSTSEKIPCGCHSGATTAPSSSTASRITVNIAGSELGTSSKSKSYSLIKSSVTSIVPAPGSNPVISPSNKSLLSFKSSILLMSSMYSGTTSPTTPLSYQGSSAKTTVSLYCS